MNYGKLINGRLIEAPNILNKDGKQYINPPEELYLEYGYLPMEYTDIPDIIDGYHLIHSWSELNGKLIQRWNYELNKEEDINTLLQQIQDLQNKIKNLEPGNHNNPIFYYNGIEVEANKWYSNGEKISQAIMTGIPDSFNDINYFN